MGKKKQNMLKQQKYDFLYRFKTWLVFKSA